MTKSKKLVGPWMQVDHDDHRWVRRIIGDSAGDHAAVVSLGAGDTWWRVYRADEASRGHAEGDVDDIEAGKVAADAHLEAAGWTIGTVTTAAADGHFTTNETTEWDELRKAEAVKRAAGNRPKVGAWIQRGGGAFVVDAHGQEAGCVWQSGPTWSWAARRAYLPQLSAHQLDTKEAAQAACLEVLRTWADVEGEQVQHSAAERFDDPEVEARHARLVCKALGGEIRKTRDILSGVDCEGDRLEDQATNAAGEIRRLRVALERWTKGTAPSERAPHVTHEGLIEQAIGMFCGRDWNDLHQGARDRVWGALRWLVDETHGVHAPAPFCHVNDDPSAPRLFVPKAIEPAGPLSLLFVRTSDDGGGIVVERRGPWGAILEFPWPPMKRGLWMWSGRAEAERDEQVGGWGFIGEWTALPLPVLP